MKKKKKIIILCAAGLIALICINYSLARMFFSGSEAEEVSYDEFLSQLEDKYLFKEETITGEKFMELMQEE